MSSLWLVASMLLGCFPIPRTDAVATIPSPAAPTPPAARRPRSSSPGLAFVAGSTTKLEQLIADIDRVTKRPTLSRTEERFGIIGSDLGSSFEHAGKLFFLFGDTIARGGTGDPIATTAAQSGEGGVRLDFLTGADGRFLKVRPPGVDMETNEVPLAGVSLGGRIYLMIKTNFREGASTDISKLVRFDERARRFEVLRDVSRLPAGHFVKVSLHHATTPIAGLPRQDPAVLMWGTGTYRKSDVYLAVTPAEAFATGEGTRYFAGLDAAGAATWAADESRAAPLFEQPVIGDLSVSFVPQVGLWLMLYDAWPGRGTDTPARHREDAGIQLRTSTTPWGPWSAPEPVLRPSDAKQGKLMHMANTDDGLEWPEKKFNGTSRRSEQGSIYAPYMIERFTRVEGDRLKLYYTLSTWNPYVVLLMRSEFTVR
jgi:hypothetical protein